MDQTITSEQKLVVRLNPVTSTGKPSSIDGAPTFTVESGDATLVVDADGLGAQIISSDVAGLSVISITADVDLGPEVKPISESINLTVVDPQASSLGLSVNVEPK